MFGYFFLFCFSCLPIRLRNVVIWELWIFGCFVSLLYRMIFCRRRASGRYVIVSLALVANPFKIDMVVNWRIWIGRKLRFWFLFLIICKSLSRWFWGDFLFRFIDWVGGCILFVPFGSSLIIRTFVEGKVWNPVGRSWLPIIVWEFDSYLLYSSVTALILLSQLPPRVFSSSLVLGKVGLLLGIFVSLV